MMFNETRFKTLYIGNQYRSRKIRLKVSLEQKVKAVLRKRLITVEFNERRLSSCVCVCVCEQAFFCFLFILPPTDLHVVIFVLFWLHRIKISYLYLRNALPQESCVIYMTNLVSYAKAENLHMLHISF